MKTWTEEQFTKAVSRNESVAGVLRELNLRPVGGNYGTVNRWIKRLGLDTSHWTGQGWSKGTATGPKRPLDAYLSNDFPIKSHPLKLRLIAEGVFEHRCSKCALSTWNELSIPLELDHINGNSQDNLLENLALLCPNCHAQTPTYRGKNIRRK